LTYEQLEAFAKEYTDLLNKYGVRVIKIHGPMVEVKETNFGADYGAMRDKSPRNTWHISEPWGG
jgi:hypothetical protein